MQYFSQVNFYIFMDCKNINTVISVKYTDVLSASVNYLHYTKELDREAAAQEITSCSSRTKT